MSRVCNVQYKLPWLNPHNVQKYKLFGVLKRLVHLKKKIVFFCSSLLLITFAHVVTNLYGFLKDELKFLSGPHTKLFLCIEKTYKSNMEHFNDMFMELF